MDIIVKKTKLSDSEKHVERINCLLYEAKNNVTVQEAVERTFKDTLRKINPKMGLANVSSRHGELVDTEFGKVLWVLCQVISSHTPIQILILL